jgi:hypothetical protein
VISERSDFYLRFVEHPEVSWRAEIERSGAEIERSVYFAAHPAPPGGGESLTIAAESGVAYTAGDAITFSSNYIADFSKGKTQAAIDFEMNGVLAHERTHIWQYNHGGGWLVEAMADYVRYRVGFDKISRRGRGGNWDSPYTTGGFFIVWIEDNYDPDFGYKVNMGMKNTNFVYKALVKQVTGKDIDALWAEYQSKI